ncbi:MAG: pilus assembly PilX N-terminal domain-containing protein [Thermoplasmata archaeon]
MVKSLPLRRLPAGAATLMLVILSLAVLTVIGIALKFSTDAERTIAANEWSLSRAFYSADAGIRWATAQMTSGPAAFLSRSEFRDPPDPFGAVLFPMPSHRHGPGGWFSGDPNDDGILILVQNPSLLGRRADPASNEVAGAKPTLFFYAFEVRVRASARPSASFAKELVADLEVGPLPSDFLDQLAAGAADGSVPVEAIIAGVYRTGGTIEGVAAGTPVRAVSMNWKEP